MVKAVQTAMIAHCEHMGDRVAILDAPPNATPQEIKDWRMNITGYRFQLCDPVLPLDPGRRSDPEQGRSTFPLRTCGRRLGAQR